MFDNVYEHLSNLIITELSIRALSMFTCTYTNMRGVPRIKNSYKSRFCITFENSPSPQKCLDEAIYTQKKCSWTSAFIKYSSKILANLKCHSHVCKPNPHLLNTTY